ncbi:hypothetical protein PENSPDRAFT_651210 [Peniophora sp. CONT]|nr:hypothetical protein PENSPDRAFT_651210 [Peniophora sp. CONT]
MRTREEIRGGHERAIDVALDAWERASATAIPEPNAGGTAFPPEVANTPFPATATASTTQAEFASVPHESLASVGATAQFDTTASNLAPEPSVPIPEAFVQDSSASDDPDSDALVALAATALETGALTGSEAEDAEAEGAGPTETRSESIASVTVREASLAEDVGDNGAATATGESGLINFDTPTVQPTGPGGPPALATDLAGGQLAADVALSPIDSRFDGSAMQSRASSPRNDEEEFDPARSPTTSAAPAHSPSSSTRTGPERRPVGWEGTWRGEGPGVIWSASSSEDPKVPGAHTDDSVSRVASTGSAVTSSPMKTFLGFMASTAGLTAGLLGGGSTESRPARDEPAPERGRSDKGKGRQVDTGSAAVATTVSVTDAPASSWRPSDEAQTSGASLGRQDESGAEVEAGGYEREERGDAGNEDQDGGDNEGDGRRDDNNAAASPSQSPVHAVDPYQGMSENQRKKARQRANERARKEAEQAKREADRARREAEKQERKRSGKK